LASFFAAFIFLGFQPQFLGARLGALLSGWWRSGGPPPATSPELQHAGWAAALPGSR
jgi:hypothetical protein